MRKAGAEMKPSAYDSPLADDDGADHRVWACRSPTFLGEAESEGHEIEVARHRFLREGAFAFTTVFDGFPPDGFSPASANAAWAAASLAIATR